MLQLNCSFLHYIINITPLVLHVHVACAYNSIEILFHEYHWYRVAEKRSVAVTLSIYYQSFSNELRSSLASAFYEPDKMFLNLTYYIII